MLHRYAYYRMVATPIHAGLPAGNTYLRVRVSAQAFSAAIV